MRAFWIHQICYVCTTQHVFLAVTSQYFHKSRCQS